MKAQTALCIVPTGFGILSGYITRYSKEVFLSDIILNSSFYDMAVNFDYLYQFAVRMSLFIAFNLIFGVYIYKNFCTASVYVFSRNSNRTWWFLKQCMQIALYGIVYMLLNLTGTLVITMIMHVTIKIDAGSLQLLILYFLVYTLWLYITTILINILAMYTNSASSFAVVSVIQLLLISLLGLFNTVFPIEDNPNPGRNIKMMLANPMAHLILGWHDNMSEAADNVKQVFNITINAEHTIVYYTVLAALVTIAGIISVNRYDIIISDHETGGN